MLRGMTAECLTVTTARRLVHYRPSPCVIGVPPRYLSSYMVENPTTTVYARVQTVVDMSKGVSSQFSSAMIENWVVTSPRSVPIERRRVPPTLESFLRSSVARGIEVLATETCGGDEATADLRGVVATVVAITSKGVRRSNHLDLAREVRLPVEASAPRRSSDRFSA